jgi:hypothetical protein
MKKAVLALWVLIPVVFAGCSSSGTIRTVPAARMVSLSNAASPEDVIDPMDAVTGWISYVDRQGVVLLGTVSGMNGQALKISYDMSNGAWVAVTKEINRDFKRAKGLRFPMMGEGAENTLEVRLEDKTGVNYGARVKQKTNTGSWTVVEIPAGGFERWWGGADEAELDWKNVKKIHFAVSKKDNDQGGAGKLMIGQVELIK